MKSRLAWLVLIAAAAWSVVLPATAQVPVLAPLAQQAQASHMAAVVLARSHYKAPPLDDALSRKILDNYLKDLDGEKFFFTQSDINEINRVSAQLDDAIIDGDLRIPFAIFGLHAQRMHERFAYARSLLKAGFDFTQKESYHYDRKTKDWPESDRDAGELWRKRVKNDWLMLKIAGDDDRKIAETLDKRYGTSQKRIARITSEEVFQGFMNAYTTAIDPHSNYMGPRAAEDFDISMSLSLFGIGASLSQKDDHTTISELIPGGPAILSGQLKVGDRIVGVGQGESGAITDIVGWRLSEAVALIRGAADTTVRLVVLPTDAPAEGHHKLVPLVRKKITLADQSAKTTILSVAEAGSTGAAGALRRVGVITLPSFYRDFNARQKGERDYRSATRDVARALDEFKRDKVDAVLIDLRNNGGGSLTEAVETAGLFVGSGPIVQQRDAHGEIKVEHGPRGERAWHGPLGVLINRASASASEIFAAAIQDYQLGVVLGEASFGKGTVQALISLDELASRPKPELGELKVTVGQFFRVNGGTTQRRGVQPDIVLPAIPSPDDFGEAAFENALPWVKIKPLAYAPAGDLAALLPALERRHQTRTANSRDFQNLRETIVELKRLQERSVVSLNEAERRREREALTARLKARSGATAADGRGVAQETTPESSDAGAASSAADKQAKDLALVEAAHILGDASALMQSAAALAGEARPASRRVPQKARRAGVWEQAQRGERGSPDGP